MDLSDLYSRAVQAYSVVGELEVAGGDLHIPVMIEIDGALRPADDIEIRDGVVVIRAEEE